MRQEILFTQRPMSAESGYTAQNINTETGQGEVYKHMGALGAGISDIGGKLYRIQGESELTQVISEANEGFQKLQLDLLNEPDPEQFAKRYNDYWNEVKGTELKNGYAKQRWNAALPFLQKSQQSAIFTAYKTKVQDNHELAIANTEAQYVNGTGSRESLEALLQSHKEFGMTDDEISLRLTLADNRREVKIKQKQNELKTKQYQDALTYTMKNPSETKKLMDKLISSGGKWDLFSELNTGDFQAIRNNAESAITRKDKETFDGIMQQMGSEQATGMPLENMNTVIRQMETIDDDMKESLWSAIKSRYTSGLYAAGKADDPWKSTRDYRSYFVTMADIDLGNIKTPQELIQRMLSSPDFAENGPPWSTEDYSKLANRLPNEPSNRPWDRTELAKRETDMIIMAFQTEPGEKDKKTGETPYYVPDNMVGVMQQYLDYASAVREQYKDEPIKAHQLVMKSLEQLKEVRAKDTLTRLEKMGRGLKHAIFPYTLYRDIYRGQYMKPYPKEETVTPPVTEEQTAPTEIQKMSDEELLAIINK